MKNEECQFVGFSVFQKSSLLLLKLLEIIINEKIGPLPDGILTLCEEKGVQTNQ